jgi:hypothetical protein
MAILPAVSSSAMHGAVVPIAYQTLSVQTATFTFSNIPQIYQDLMLVITAANNGSAQYQQIRLNGDSSTNYSNTLLQGDGSSAASARTASSNAIGEIGVSPNNSPSTLFGSTNIHILNYSNNTTNKTVLSRNAADANGSGYSILNVGLYRNTSAITSISFLHQAGSGFVAGSTFALYGIRTVNQ